MRQVETRYGLLQIPANADDIICRFLARYGEWSWLETRFVAEVLEDGTRILDVGAFVGTFGLGVALARDLQKLVFVEANSLLIQDLSANASRNLKCEFEIVEGLVGNAEEQARLGHAHRDNLGSTSFAEGNIGSVEIKPPKAIISLKDLREENGSFDLIKLDIEGMELAALAGDSDYLSGGDSTLWVECNESVHSLQIADLLLSWSLDVYYFAYPSYNKFNFKHDKEPIFPMAYEAGLLVAPKTLPRISPELEEAGCFLRKVTSRNDLKLALWQTPRWGRPEWEFTTSRIELAAAVSRSLRDEDFLTFLEDTGGDGTDQRATLWQRLAEAETGLHEAQSLVAEERVLRINAEEKWKELEKLALSRLEELRAEQDSKAAVELAFAEAEAFAVERLQQLAQERELRETIEAALNNIETLANERTTALADATVKREAAEETASQYLVQLKSERSNLMKLENKIKELLQETQLAADRAAVAERELASASARSLAHIANLGVARELLEVQRHELYTERAKGASLEESLLKSQVSLLEAQRIADSIRTSTVWRATAPLRTLVERSPALHSTLKRIRPIARTILRQKIHRDP